MHTEVVRSITMVPLTKLAEITIITVQAIVNIIACVNATCLANKSEKSYLWVRTGGGVKWDQKFVTLTNRIS